VSHPITLKDRSHNNSGIPITVLMEDVTLQHLARVSKDLWNPGWKHHRNSNVLSWNWNDL